jgi:hypothetical protein
VCVGPTRARRCLCLWAIRHAFQARNGTSWTNAAAIPDLEALIAAVGPGGGTYVPADAGPYAFEGDPVSIVHGGTEKTPVTVIGVDCRPLGEANLACDHPR